MDTIHFVLVGFGDVGTRIFPTLLQIKQEQRNKLPSEQNLRQISIVDVHEPDVVRQRASEVLSNRFPHYSDIQYDEKAHIDFLMDNYFRDTRPEVADSIPPALFRRIGAKRTIVYLATDPDQYLTLLHKYWPLGDIFAIEKPLARESPDDTRMPSHKAHAIEEFAERYRGIFDKVFVPVDHYLGKYMLTVFEYIRTIPEFAEVINDANTIIFQFLETKIDDPSLRPYFAKTGIIADMMPHVLALLTKIFGPGLAVSKQSVVSSRVASYDEQCSAAGIKERNETYAEIELRVSEHRHADRTVMVRIGKGVGVEERKVAFVDSRGHTIEMSLPFTADGCERPGQVLLKTPGTPELVTELLPGGHQPERWDKAWYNIILSLMAMELGKPPDIFLGIPDAKSIITVIEDLRS